MGYWIWLIKNIVKVVKAFPFFFWGLLKYSVKACKDFIMVPEHFGTFGAILFIIPFFMRIGLDPHELDLFIWHRIENITNVGMVLGFLILTYAIYRAGGLFKGE